MPATSTKAAKARQSKPAPLPEVFDALRELMKPYAKTFRVMHDKAGLFYLESKIHYKGKPMFVGGVRLGKSFVSIYFIPMYCYPEMIKSFSPALKKRVSGKACFNFKAVEPGLFSELAEHFKRGFGEFARIKDYEAVMGGRSYT